MGAWWSFKKAGVNLVGKGAKGLGNEVLLLG